MALDLSISCVVEYAAAGTDIAEPPSSPSISAPTSSRSTLPYAASCPAASDIPPPAVSMPTAPAPRPAFCVRVRAFKRSSARFAICAASATSPSSLRAASIAERRAPVANLPAPTVIRESTAAVVTPLVLASLIACSTTVLSRSSAAMFSSVGGSPRSLSFSLMRPMNSEPISSGTPAANPPPMAPAAAPTAAPPGPAREPAKAPPLPPAIMPAIWGAMFAALWAVR